MAMNQKPQPTPERPSVGGGVFIAVLALVGVFAGGFMGQPTLGLLGGLFLGSAIAILLWLRERPRRD